MRRSLCRPPASASPISCRRHLPKIGGRYAARAQGGVTLPGGYNGYIAAAVLDERRTFPNAIVLVTNARSLQSRNGDLQFPSKSKFLIVDGQHRLWAQTFASFEAKYACIVHMGLSEVEMAKLFLEINDTQKRVPASLRWDLVRLVRPEEDPYMVQAADLVYALATEKESPLYQRVDLTGEVPRITLKQGSIAPELKMLVSTRAAGLRDLDFDVHYDILVRYLAAIRSVDPDGWRSGDSPLYGARVLRMLLRLLHLIIKETGRRAEEVTTGEYRSYLQRLDLASLSDEEIRAAQGSAGMKEIFEVLRTQVLGRGR